MIMFPKLYTLKRRVAEGYFDNSGDYIEGSQNSDTSISADCQPLSAKEIESLNIGRENLGKIKIFSDVELIIAIPGEDGNYLQNGDRIVYDNDEYEIIQRNKFQNNLINHYEYIGEYRT